MASAPQLNPPPGPGVPIAGLRSYRLPPDGSAGVFRLLVIPVRFPEDHILGGGGEAALRARLTGEGVDGLTGFYAAATAGLLRLEVTLAPTVVATHERPFYTSEGESNLGFGLDPDAYPHNAQFLAEEVTARVAPAVDFRRFDNTADGIADGVLILHSGPAAPEAGGVSDRSALLAHAFTIPRPARRGDAWVFPYAVASTSDGVGPWAHETGHLLGLPDVYVGNPYTPGEGVGEWSLMATGANVNGGDTPSGLDAASLLRLGVTEVYSTGAPVSLADTTFLRAFRAGEETGPEYFLVERRDGSDGLWIPRPATLVYRIDERVGDNRDPSRPRVELLAEVCAGQTPCTATLDDGSDPPLRDTAGRPTFLTLEFTRDTVHARHAETRGLRVFELRLGPETGGPRRLTVGLENALDVEAASIVVVEAPGGGPVCAERVGGNLLLLPPRGTARDSSWYLTDCAGAAPPPTTVPLTVRFGSGLRDSTVFAARTGETGLAAGELGSFTSWNLAPGRPDPWFHDEATGSWRAEPLAPLADAVLVSPWFTVPDSGRLALAHAWDITTLAPDYAQDALRVELDTQTEPLRALEPAGGWGFEAERGTGNALAGARVLAGAGDRWHVLALGGHAGRTVRLRLRAAGDAAGDASTWAVREAVVTGPPSARLALADTLAGSTIGVAGSTAVSGSLYGGPAPGTPTTLLAELSGPGVVVDPGAVPGSRRRYDLVWRDAAGRAGADAADLNVAPRRGTGLLAVSPNPMVAGSGQTWHLNLPGSPLPGRYRLTLVDASGRRVVDRTLVLTEPGRRRTIWLGRDEAGRIARPGVYFLRCLAPDGGQTSRKVVVIP